jgi:hypothetical protein
MSLCLFGPDGRPFWCARQPPAFRASTGHTANFDHWSHGDPRRSKAVQLFQAMVEVARGFCDVVAGMVVFHVEHWRLSVRRCVARAAGRRGRPRSLALDSAEPVASADGIRVSQSA